MGRRGSSLLIAAIVAAMLMALPILVSGFHYDETIQSLTAPANLLVLPGGSILRAFSISEPDLPELVFVNWLFYTVIAWPLIGIFTRAKYR
jgi:hypothetical protein